MKYPLADYELLPKMAIIDADMMMSMPKGLTSASGIDAMTHALEAYASMMATDYTDGLALKALKNIFTYLPRAYNDGANDPVAREPDGRRLHHGRHGLCQCLPGCVPIPWPISSARSTTCPTVWPTPCSSMK